MAHDIRALEKKVTALSKALANLGKGTDLRDLILIIKRPGWTTPAEFALVNTLVDHLQVSVNNFANVQKELVKGSKMVGK